MHLTSRTWKCKSVKTWPGCLGLSLPLLKHRLETTSLQTYFVWPAQCFKQFWIGCQQVKKKKKKQIQSFPGKLEIARTRKTSRRATQLGGSCPLSAKRVHPGVSLQGPLPASLTRPAAGSLRHLQWPPWLQGTKAGVSLCLTLSLMKIPATKILLNFRDIMKKNDKMSTNYLELTVMFSALPAHWNHLGSFKKYGCLGSTPRETDCWSGEQPGHEDGSKLLTGSPGWERLPSEDASCWAWSTKFIPVSTSQYDFLASVFHNNAYHFLFLRKKKAITPKDYQMPFTNLKRRSKCVLVSTMYFPSKTTEMLRKWREIILQQNSDSTDSSNTIRRDSQWQAYVKKYNCFEIHQWTKWKNFQILKKRTISLRLSSNSPIFVLRKWIPNYYLFLSFLRGCAFICWLPIMRNANYCHLIFKQSHHLTLQLKSTFSKCFTY